jgi:hypothetical protein
MRGLHAAAALLIASLTLAACGESETFSDGKISDAIGAEDDQIGGDPFCVVADYLNDREEIEQADGRDAPVITSGRGEVGVRVKPPFPSDCEQKVRRGLNRLDPRDEE